MIRSLITIGWLRDVMLVLLLAAGNHLRHTTPLIGLTIMAAAVVIFTERFLWAWHLCALREKQASPSQ